jgi:threonine/homoserine/homoserine lactone efflux protein
MRGVIIGFSIAAAIGPISFLCMQRTLADGRMAGLLSGLGAATADAIYGCVAGFGLRFIAAFLMKYSLLLQFVGGVFLCFLGIRIALRATADQTALVTRGGLARAYSSALVLTLTNPITILAFLSVFAAFGIGSAQGSYSSAAFLVAGVFLGSALWWFVLNSIVASLRAQFTASSLFLVIGMSAAVVFTFGLAAVVNSLSAALALQQVRQ